MDKQAKILLAGYKGLVGSTIFKKLKDKGYSNILAINKDELNLLDQHSVDEFFSIEKPEYVFLAAAKVGGIHANNTYKADFLYQNIMIAANVINCAYKYNVKKLLNLGSSCIYPKLAIQPLKEKYLLTGELEPTNEPYALAKIAAIKLCQFYNEQYKTNFISVMPTNLYGPNDNFNLMNSHVLPALIRRFHLGKLLQENDFESIIQDFKKHREEISEVRSEIVKKLEELNIFKESVLLWGTGKPYREFLFVHDLADAVVFLMEKYNYDKIGQFINIGTGKDVTITELACLIKDIVGYKGNIEYDSSKPDGTPKKLLDVSRLSALGWKYTTELKDGIKRTYSWYCDN